MTENPLAQLYAQHQGKVSDKWALYLREYDRLFAPWREEPITLVEIGVQNGGSLELWARYFPRAQRILGVDIDPGCAELRFDDPRIEVLVGDAGAPETVARLRERVGQAHLLIEDGSHRSGDIIRAFAHYLGLLTETGLFIAEDLHCSYWREFEGGLYDPYSAMAFLKTLADVLNRDHWGMTLSAAEVLAPFGLRHGFDPEAIPIEQIHSITFLDSLCVIRKAPSGENVLGERWAVGQLEVVEPGRLATHGAQSQALDQADNPWLLADPPLAQPTAPLELCALHARSLAELTALARREREHCQRQEALHQERIAHAERCLFEEREGHRQALARAADEQRELLNRLETQQEARDRLEAHAERLAASLSAMRQSMSWRLTAPLRGARAVLNTARRAPGFLSHVVAFGGGPGATLATAWRVLREEGLRGVRWRLDHVRRLRAERPEVPAEGLLPSDRNHYQEWIRRYDTLDAAAREQIRERIKGLNRAPRISVVMPVYNAPLRYLDEAIRSVREQLYPHWELCIADDASTDAAVRDLIRRHLSEEPRIKAAFREENGHISAASNSALALATGDFVALLDHDDRLPEHALFWVAVAIDAHPEAGLFYSDEDKLCEAGRRHSPYFKCAFNHELLLAQNMISHLGVYRRSLLDHLQGFRLGFEGAQDYDLALRVSECLEREQIVHIPRILYHWRAHANSTALAPEEKHYASERGRRAVYEHLARLGLKAEVTAAPDWPNYNRVRFSLPESRPRVSILVLTRDRADLLSLCIFSILNRSTYENLEILIVDNGSVEPETLALFSRLQNWGVKILREDAPFNFSRLNNRGMRELTGDVVCLLNNDIEILTPDWVEEMLSCALRPDIGCVGARLWYPDERLQHGGVVLGIGGVAGHAHKHLPKHQGGYFGNAVLQREFSAVTAACLMIRRELYEAVGGLDESLEVAFNDIDFCLRVRQAGYRNVWSPYAEMIHHESASRGLETTPEKQQRFAGEVRIMRDKWGDVLDEDPAYSPNLSLEREDFSLAWPPRLKSPWSLSE
ncbi:MAG: glycosyltransferase [Chromatiaceae bacterium]|nr:glycosyltransferase [Chromatiaceae bacterium]